MVSWTDHFYYDETSVSCLRWARTAANNRVKIGDVAGSCTAGYYQIKVLVEGEVINARSHRVVWEMFNGEIPENCFVDHFDRDVSNNRISNLRLVLNRANCQNRGMHPSNKSGVTGVHLKNNGANSTYWCAQWMGVDNRKQVLNFSVEKYGYDEAFNLAVDARETAIRELNAAGMAYTEQHGKER